ncbi:hypothetical protein CEXT_165371 [Caerostris extrusa]|uniref:Uncharacterized protein n=1 Tax=Caerostris extrusa TaxID=172846 RepID=A0AAV4T4E2_CAEEX|nr:hypothetical protein CEXT_165371 [Caerostris extrusa]
MPSYPRAHLQQLLGTHLNDAAGRRSGSIIKTERVSDRGGRRVHPQESLVNGLNWFWDSFMTCVVPRARAVTRGWLVGDCRPTSPTIMKSRNDLLTAILC